MERLGRAAAAEPPGQAAEPPGQWVRGKLFDPSLYPGEPDLTAAILDRVAPRNPLVVANTSMHFLYANSAALAHAHITPHTPNPPAGRYLRANGVLTGVISEMPAIMPVLSALPQIGHEDLLDGLTGILTHAASQGVTKVHEGGTGALFGGRPHLGRAMTISDAAGVRPKRRWHGRRKSSRMSVKTAKEVAMANDPQRADDPELEGTDILGPEAGGTDILGHEEGGTDVLGPEAGGTDVLGPEEGGTDILGPEAGGTDVLQPPSG